MASTNQVTYALYANSFGSNKTYYPDRLEENPRDRFSVLSKVIDGLEREINSGIRVHFISEEFRAKALSAFLESTDPENYVRELEKLKELPVARTPEQLKVLKDDRDKAVDGNYQLFNQAKEYKKYIPIGDIQANAKNDKFEDRSDYVEKALALVTSYKKDVRKGNFKLLKKVDPNIKNKNEADPDFKKDIELLTAEFTNEGYKLPRELNEYRAALQEEEDVPVAATATDTPSVPDAQQVDPESGEEILPKPSLTKLEEAMAKSTSLINRTKTAASIRKAEDFVRDNTALRDVPQFIEIQGSREAIPVTNYWKLMETIVKEEVRVTSAFKQKLMNYWEGLQPTSRPRHIKTYNSIMELETYDEYYDQKASDARAIYYDGNDPEEMLDQTLEDIAVGEGAEPVAEEDVVEGQGFQEPDEPPVFDEMPNGAHGQPPPVVQPQPEAPPVIQAQQTDEERRREIEAQNRDLIDQLTPEQRARLFTAPVRVLENWVQARRYAIEADVQGNVDLDEADNGANDGFFGLRNNYINAILLSAQYDFNDFIRVRDLLQGQPMAVYEAALQRIRARPNQAIAFDQQFLNEVLQQQNDAGNIVEGAGPVPGGAAMPEVDNEIYAGLGPLFYEYPQPPDPPAEPPAETIAGPAPVSGSQPITGTGSDSEKLNYVKRVHPDVIEIFFGQSSYPDWDTELEKKLMSMEMSEARRIEIMEDVIAEYGTKIFIKARKGSSKEELNELVQLQFCVMRNLQRGPRAKTASIKVSDLVRMQSLAAGNGAPTIPQPAAPGAQPPVDPLVAQQAANIQAAPKPMITEARGEITNAQVQTFSEAKFISDYSRMQMAKNLNSGVKLEYPNPVPKIFNNQTPQTVNHPGRAAGLGKRKVTGFSSGKF